MRVLMAMIAGAIASFVGAAIWTAVGYYGNVEIGWIAWGIGALAGIGVFIGSGRKGDVSLGVLAVLFALTGILIGKYATAYVTISHYAESDAPFIAGFAEEIIYERNKAGENWPIGNGWSEDLNSIEKDYPPAIWIEAKSQWNALTDAERAEVRGMPYLVNKNFHIVYMCDQLALEYMDAGKPVNWPPGMSSELAFREEDYPLDMWADAVSRWNAMGEADQQSYRAAMIKVETARSAQDKALWQAETTLGVFKASFSPYDALWAVLAVLSAFKIGSASASRETAATV